jgi:hypothetical protein
LKLKKFKNFKDHKGNYITTSGHLIDDYSIDKKNDVPIGEQKKFELMMKNALKKQNG